MISIVGIGTGASAIAKNFADISQYDVYTLNDAVEENTENEFYLPSYETPEEYDNHIPDF